MNKKSVAKKVRNVSISIIVLLILMIGGGIFYTWYMGKNTTPVDNSILDTNTARVEIKPHEPAPDAKVGVAIHMFTSPVKAGDSASMSIRTNAKATCTITATYNDEEKPSKDPGLITKQADEFGIVSWTWVVDNTAPKGKWPVEVTCKNEVNSGYVRGDLVVKG